MQIILIGGGASNLIAAHFLSKSHQVSIYEKGKTVGRKFLVAGNGGFNLTNQASGSELLKYYSPTPILRDALTEFGTKDTRKWLGELGIPTFIGSSGRVFPKKGMKPIQVLKIIKDALLLQEVKIHTNHEFINFSEDKKPIFEGKNGQICPEADTYIFGLGGASWSVTGSNQKWLSAFENIGIKTKSFRSSNCGIEIKWSEDFVKNYAGKPLKNIKLLVGDFEIKGEALITDYGLEGNAVYPCTPSIRRLLSKKKEAQISIDFKPQNTLNQLLDKVKGKNIQPKNYKYIFRLSKEELALIKAFTSKEEYLSVEKFISKIKKLTLPVHALRPIEEAISTVGGIDFSELNSNFALKKYPHLFVIGEMLDWDAPTGGFLLQGCFSSGVKVAHSINNQ